MTLAHVRSQVATDAPPRLCGFEPFAEDSDEKMFSRILACDFSFPSPYWDDIGDNAKVGMIKFASSDAEIATVFFLLFLMTLSSLWAQSWWYSSCRISFRA